MKTTLLIMAAGIGSRFGTGIKQLEPVDYAFQDINDIPGTLPEGRTKPWGTGQAVLAAKKVIKTPFIVINADDYYGKEGFKAVHEYLVNGGKSCMAGFVLKNTLSDNGGVTRGICKMNEDYNLTEVVETKNIVKTAAGAEAEGMAVDVDSLVSMNMWGLTPDFLTTLEEGFKEFFEKEVPGNPLKAEYLIPKLGMESSFSYEVISVTNKYFSYDSYDEEATDSKPISSYSDAELRKLVKDFSEKELCLLNMYLQMCTQENSYNIEEFRKAKASQSAMTKAETEQAIIKIEDLFKKIGINKALRGQTP